MAHGNTTPPEDMIGQVEHLARERLPGIRAAEFIGFLRQYYAQVDPGDLAERTVADLYGAALSHWHFMQRFTRGAARLRVYNPNLSEHGWQSSHTVIEIVNDDMPFLVDSVTMEVNRQGLTLHLIIHPVLQVVRDLAGVLREVLPADVADRTCCLESLMHVEVDRRTDPAALEELRAGVERVLADVRRAVEDWRPQQQRMRECIAWIEARRGSAEAEEAKAFLAWAVDEHFTFIGCRDYDLTEGPDGPELRAVPGSGLGILREEPAQAISASFAALPREVRELARAPGELLLTKANARSTVHRPGYLDYIGVKRFDPGGRVIGERRFLGLYTHTAYSANPLDIPILRLKVRAVMARAGFLAGGHLAKDLQTLLESYPRDELFQSSVEQLYGIAMGILRLGERQRIRLFVRPDPFGRFVSCLVYVPREIYTTDLRRRFQAVLMEAYGGTSSEFTVQLSESVLARILITVHGRPGSIPRQDVRAVEARLVRAARRWQDDLQQALLERHGEEEGLRLLARYGGAFPGAYRDDTPARDAVQDIGQLEALAAGGPRVHLYRLPEAPAGSLRFKLFQSGGAIPLSTSLPMLEHMGVKVQEERSYRVTPEGAASAWIHDYGMAYEAGGEFELGAVREKFEEAFLRVWRGEAESDDFNRLVLRAGLAWREVAMLRACGRYLRQAGFTFSQAYMEQALASNPGIARALVELFHARFDPGRSAGRDEAVGRIAAAIEAALERVASLDEDRILRRHLALIQAMLRTNYFQHGAAGAAKPYLSFKLDPARVPGLPEPRPMFEIFVYSPRVEGVHLRGGKVARGGIRWSDRMEDFRTEVLGLMKAQMVKNAVIVPVGSKGGFVVKSPPPEREALGREGVACYSTLLRGMLDLTDNLAAGRVAPPAGVVRHDGDDPYLVVAADKGTAGFSDIANGISREYGFWLGDAFASGGSAGYDHKKMGITARGAWESAKRHFREMGVDIQATDFTVVGIGDMSGDVFGNGMLLSRHIRLIGAFDHRHVFLDPDPEPEASYGERERLFALPRSSWADYDPKLISRGGGVWARSAKSVPISPQARKALGIEAQSLSPADLIRALLRAPVDLLYNGGIGTYVKASTETHADVGDRGNDALRVDARELRCRVVVEGGNLGITQRGRIEYALAGGRINTDAIDNSGGVDTSDHEVNIKILLDAVVAQGELTMKQRDALLAEMTGEVQELVLRDNYFQNQSLFLGGILARALLDAQSRFIRFLERAGRLNRALEFLPDEEEIAARARAGLGLTCPERSVLLAYGKLWLYDELLASDLPEDSYIGSALQRYFPRVLRERYAPYMERHPLRREIIATYVVNSMVNRVGPTFVHRIQEEAGTAPAQVVRAYVAARQVYDLAGFWGAVQALDGRVAVQVQAELLIEAGRLIYRATLWFLGRPALLADIGGAVARFAPGVRAVEGGLAGWLGEPERAAMEARVAALADAGVPRELAWRGAALDALYSALDVVSMGEEAGRSPEAVAAVYFGVSSRLHLPWLRAQIGRLPTETHWQARARAALRDDLAVLQRQIAVSVLQLGPAGTAAGELIGAWEARAGGGLERVRQVFAELQAGAAPELAMLSVALRELRALI
jgi:glutamate dehydrogenase